MKTPNLIGSAMPILTFGLALSFSGASQQATAAAAEDRSGTIEELVVTSRRRAESSQDVPLAVTAFNMDDIERIQPDTLRDIDGQMPNVFIGRQTAGPSMGAIYIRGLGYADVEKNVPPAVGVMIDGVYQGTTTGQLIDTFDIEQIEVNRGPQGVLFGKNTTGGTIVVKRVQPEFNEWGFNVAGELGNYDRRNLKGRVNIPIVDDTLALKLGGILKQRDGYWENVNPDLGGSIGDVDYQSYTAALKWSPTDSLVATLTYDRLKDRSDSVAMDARYNGDDPFINENDWDAETRYDQDMLGLVIDWDIGGVTLSSVTGWVDSSDWVEQDFDSATRDSIDASVSPVIAPEPLAQLHTLRDQSYEQFSQEFRIAGDLTQTVHYTAGLFYWDSEISLNQTTNAIAQLGNFTQGTANPLTCAQFGDFVNGVVPGFILPHAVLGDAYCQTPHAPDPTGEFGPFRAGLSNQDAGEEVTSWAVFGAVDWEVTDNLELSAGLRFIDEEKKFRNNYVSLGQPTPAGFPVSDKQSWDDVIFKLTGNWAVTDNNRLYLSYSEGFRSGGFAIRSNNVNQLTYDPEDVKTIEFGSKNDLLDGKLRLNATLFHTNMRDQQYPVVIQDPFQAPGTTTPINNADKTKISGLEIDGTWILADDFRLVGQVGLQDAERKAYDEDCTRVPVPPLGTAGGPGTSCPDSILLPAQQLPRAPDWNWSLTGVYDHMFGSTRFMASLTVRGQDDFVISSNLLTGESTVTQDGYTLVDGRVALEWNLNSGDLLSLSLHGRNLGDKVYKDYELPLGDTGGFQGYGPPRHYGLELRWAR